MYYNYHAKIKNLIKSGHCLGYEILAEYHNICPCMLVFFDNHKPIPVREKRFSEYLEIFDVLHIQPNNTSNIVN